MSILATRDPHKSLRSTEKNWEGDHFANNFANNFVWETLFKYLISLLIYKGNTKKKTCLYLKYTSW